MPKDPSPPELDEAMKTLADMLTAFDPDVAGEFGHWILRANHLRAGLRSARRQRSGLFSG